MKNQRTLLTSLFNLEWALNGLEEELNRALDQVLSETLAKLRTLTRQVGQRTRTDRKEVA